jgi:peptidyl-tRNA hydrolase
MNFTKIFKEYDYLGKALSYIIKEDKESLYHPYHNLNHNITVTIFCKYIGDSENLNKKQMKELLLAAIFHDFNHSGGKEKDDYNIKNAKKGFSDFIKESEEDVDEKVVYKIIDATEFPYKKESKELGIQEKIIRDADMCQLFEPNRLQFNYLGLQSEMGIDFSTQLNNQEKFYPNIKFNTSFAKKMFEKSKKQIFEELEYLNSIYK